MQWEAAAATPELLASSGNTNQAQPWHIQHETPDSPVDDVKNNSSIYFSCRRASLFVYDL